MIEWTISNGDTIGKVNGKDRYKLLQGSNAVLVMVDWTNHGIWNELGLFSDINSAKDDLELSQGVSEASRDAW